MASPNRSTITRRLAALLAILAGGCGEATPRTSVLLISIDTLRADHLTPWGYERETGSTFARLAAEGVRFDQAHAHSTATLASHLSLFSSMLPPQIGVTRADGTNDTQATTTLRLSDFALTLTEVLRNHGYRTAAFTDGVFVHPAFGLGQGFETFEANTIEEGAFLQGLPKSVDRVEEWLDEDEEGRPFFLFVHTYDVHEPYSAPPPFETAFSKIEYTRFHEEKGYFPHPFLLGQHRDELSEEDLANVRGFYDNGILATDRALARLLALLEERGLYDDLLIVLLSDHGEEFQDHGAFGHGHRVFQELARVPLLFKLPGGRRAGQVIEHPVGLVDVAPTVLQLVGFPNERRFEGVGLADVILGTEDGAWLEERPVYVDNPDKLHEVIGWRVGPWKLIKNPSGRHRLYHLGRDPGETENLAKEEADRAAAMAADLDEFLADVRRKASDMPPMAVPRDLVLGEDHEAALRALGYTR